MLIIHRPYKRLFLSMAFMGLWMSACSRFQIDNSLKHDKDDPTPQQQFISVPFFPDKTDQCGPSSLASVMAYWGKPVSPVQLKKEIYLSSLKGSLPIDLLIAAQQHGFQATLYNGSLNDLQSELNKGHPLVAFINRGFDFYPIGHYVVISGYDNRQQKLVIHSGPSKNLFVSYKTFLHNWDKTQRSTLLILPLAKNKGIEHEKT